jgi:hypothetical protein
LLTFELPFTSATAAAAGATHLLAVEDPQQHGRDIASGSRAVLDVVEAFSWAADSIRKMVAHFEGTAEGRQQLAAAAGSVQGSGAQPAAAAAAGGQASKAGTKLQGLSEEQQWAMIQAEGQSQSLQLGEQQQQEQGQAELQQQLLQGYVFLGNLIDVYGALGRGSAAEAHRQQLAAAAAAARKSKAEQQQQQKGRKKNAMTGQTQFHIVNGQLQGVKLTGKKAKKLKVAGLDKQRPAAAVAPAQIAAAAPAVADIVVGSQLLNDPELLAAIHVGLVKKKTPTMRPQRAMQLYGGSMRAVAAAEDALKQLDLAGAAAAARTARNCLAEATSAALANADVSAAGDVGGMFEIMKVRKAASVPDYLPLCLCPLCQGWL